MNGPQVGGTARALFVVDTVQQAGGLERVLADRLAFLADDPQIDVHLATIDPPGARSFFPLHPDVAWHRLDVPIDRNKSLFTPTNLGRGLVHARRLRRLMRKLHPHVVVNADHNFMTYALPLMRGDAVLMHEHHSSHDALRRDSAGWRAKDRLRRLAEARFDRRLYLSDVEAAQADPGASVLPNPLIPAPAGSLAAEREPLILAAGRIAEVKRFDRLIDLFVGVADAFPQWRLRIRGDGDSALRDRLVAKAEASGVGERIAILPATDDLAGEMRRASIFAMTSRNETFPMVLLEAMRERLPIIAYDCPSGPRVILRNGALGALVPDGDAAAFREALARLMDDPERRAALAERAAEEADHYSMEAIGGTWKRWILDARDAREGRAQAC